MMMFAGDAHGMVSGACHTTADTMRPALQVSALPQHLLLTQRFCGLAMGKSSRCAR
jgi:phosphotransacetylase